MVEYRRDSLWAPLEPETGPNHYLRPHSNEPLPDELVADVAGPGIEFLLRCDDLPDFAAWAQEVYRGDRHPNWWGRFRPVLPQGTAPLQAAAFAAATAGDVATCERMTTRVLSSERDRRERDDFLSELTRLAPGPAAPAVNAVSAEVRPVSH